jgi:hypothetical protein
VTVMIVVPWLLLRLASSLTISCLFFESKFPVGSSARIKAGLLAKARAMRLFAVLLRLAVGSMVFSSRKPHHREQFVCA